MLVLAGYLILSLSHQTEAITQQQSIELNRAISVRNAKIALENEILRKYNTALQAYQNKDYQQCIGLLTNNYIRERFQNKRDYSLALGDSYFNLKQFQGAITNLRRAEQQGAGNYQILQRDLGLSYSEIGNNQEAANYLQRLSNQARMPAALWYKLALAYNHLSNESMELLTIKKLIDEYPSFNADSYIRLGEIYLSHKREKDALQVYVSGLRYFPNDAVLSYGTGYILYLGGNFGEAISYLLKSNEVGPDNLDTLYYLGASYLQIDDLDKAASVANVMVKINAKDSRTIDLNKAVQQKIMQRQMEQQMQQDMINQDIQNQQQIMEQAASDQAIF